MRSALEPVRRVVGVETGADRTRHSVSGVRSALESVRRIVSVQPGLYCPLPWLALLLSVPARAARVGDADRGADVDCESVRLRRLLVWLCGFIAGLHTAVLGDVAGLHTAVLGDVVRIHAGYLHVLRVVDHRPVAVQILTLR